MLKAPLVLILSFVVFVALGMPEVALAVSVVVGTVEAGRFAVAGLTRLARATGSALATPEPAQPAYAWRRISR